MGEKMLEKFIEKRVLRTGIVLLMAFLITLISTGIVSAKSIYWIVDSAKTIKQGSVVSTDNVNIPAGEQSARLHSIECTHAGNVYVSRNTKGWFFWSTQKTVSGYFSAANQYRYFDLGEENSTKKTYYTITNFRDELDTGSQVNVRIADCYVTIE